MNGAAVSMGFLLSRQYPVFIRLYPEVELLDHMLVLLLTFLRRPMLSSIEAEPLHIPSFDSYTISMEVILVMRSTIANILP